MILGLEGEEATGKTTLAYTAPTPIVGFSFDLGTSRALNGTQYDAWFKGLKIDIVKYVRGAKPVPGWKGNDITVYELPRPIQLTPEKLVGFMELWEYFIVLIAEAYEDDKVKSIVVDTMTLARRIKADAYLQELQTGPGRPRKQLIQIEYGNVNDSIRNLYDMATATNKNLIATHHLTDERKDGVDKDGSVVSMLTGNRIIEGLNQTYRHLDVAMRMEKAQGKLQGVIRKCGYNLDLEGSKIPNPSWNSLMNRIEMSLGDRVKFEHRETVNVPAK